MKNMKGGHDQAPIGVILETGSDGSVANMFLKR